MNKRQCSNCNNLLNRVEVKTQSKFHYFCIRNDDLQPINLIQECSLANNGKGGVNLF